MRRVVALVLTSLLVGCSVYSASSWNRAQWDAQRAFLGCVRTAGGGGQAYVAYNPAPDGTLYYTPLVRPEAQARLADCLRTEHPDLNAVAGARPK